MKLKYLIPLYGIVLVADDQEYFETLSEPEITIVTVLVAFANITYTELILSIFL